MLKVFVFMLSIVAGHSFVYGNEKSSGLICPKKFSMASGVRCCFQETQQLTCSGLVRKFVSANHLLQVAQVRQEIMSGVYKDFLAPNCFWNALALTHPEIRSRPHSMSITDFKNELSINYKPVPKKQTGDIAVLVALQHWHHDAGGDVFVETLLHAGVVIDENYLFQKENDHTQVFSVAGVETSFNKYIESYNSDVNLPRATFRVDFYRKK